MSWSRTNKDGFCDFHGPTGADPCHNLRPSNVQVPATALITAQSHHEHVVARASPAGVVVNPTSNVDYYTTLHGCTAGDYDINGLRSIYNECNGDGYLMVHLLTNGSCFIDFLRLIASDGIVNSGQIQACTITNIECYSRKGILRRHPVSGIDVLDAQSYEQYEYDFRNHGQANSPMGAVIDPVVDADVVENGKHS